MAGATIWLENYVPACRYSTAPLPLIWKYLPESLMYLTNKQQTAQAQHIIQKISPTQVITSDTQFVLNEVQKGMKRH